ncbi:MAG: hypothetical protein MJE68_27925 [Proteobacteria bacterium]|nr:hypothetical protein [Pseudomonadota bacterium]
MISGENLIFTFFYEFGLNDVLILIFIHAGEQDVKSLKRSIATIRQMAVSGVENYDHL